MDTGFVMDMYESEDDEDRKEGLEIKYRLQTKGENCKRHNFQQHLGNEV